MKIYSKILVFVVTFSMLVNMGICVKADDAAETTDTRVIKILSALNIIDETNMNNFQADDTITRAEFASMAVRMLGVGKERFSANTDSSFSDVKADDAAAADIAIASKMGIINGYEDNKFEPEAPVNYEQAVKVIVSTLGLDLYAKSKGGYPTGYLVVASEKGITKDAYGAVGTPVKRGVVTQMIYNALEVDLMEQVVYGDKANFSISRGKTLLTEKLDVEKEHGRVNGTGYTQLTGSSTLKDDEVEIDGIIYKIGNTDAKDFLGYNVTFYYKNDKDNDNKTIVYIEMDENKNSVITITADDIDEYENHRYTYNQHSGNEEKIKEAVVSVSADLIFNGKACTLADEFDLAPAAGKVTLLDTDGDSEYDVIFLTSYIDYVVNSVSVTDNIVRDKYGNPDLNLDPNDKDLKITITKDASPIGIGDLKENDILTVAADKEKKVGSRKMIDTDNATVLNITVASKSVDGKVTETGDDTVTINGEEYKVADSYKQAIQNGYAKEIVLDDEDTFYLDFEGRIATVGTVTLEKNNYGYLVKVAKGDGLKNNIECKLYNDEGHLVTLTSKEKIKLDGYGEVSGETVFNTFIDTDGNTVPQMIGYSLNSEGEIDGIDSTNITSGEDTEQSLRLSVSSRTKTLNYKSSGRSFDGLFVASDTAKVFVLPEDAANAKEEDFDIKDKSYFANDGDYYVDAYNVSEALVSNLIVVYPRIIIKGTAPWILVDKISTMVNADGEQVPRLYGLQKGVPVTLEFTGYDVLSEAGISVTATGQIDLSRGDVIRYTTNKWNQIILIQRVFDVSEKPTYNESTADYDASYRSVYGQVYGKDSKSIAVTRGVAADQVTSPNNIYVHGISGVKIMLYDEEENKVRAASETELDSYMRTRSVYSASRVFLHGADGDTKDLIIMKLNNI